MTRVALLWHMHQPFYQDLATGEHALPWVRLHATKDYWGMVALLREYPSVRMTFNLVPSLLVQLEAFARDEARDEHLALGLKAADQLTPDERAFCVDEFFHAHRPRMIDPHPRYAELFALRGPLDGRTSAAERAARFSAEDLRDLQVWHKLVWIDQSYLDGDARVRQLVAKGRQFNEADKALLRQVELELLRKVIPEYRAAADRGQIEIATSPFYHPILPLLCDTDVHLRAHPGARMPREPYRRPEDAALQLSRATALHERLFGCRPQGLWPSEGSVSDDMLPIVAAAGFRWMATDEAILGRTTGHEFQRDGQGQVDQPEWLYRPYRVGQGDRQIGCGFRDHALSDLIGFSYASWRPESAAEDFTQRLLEAGRRYASRTGGDDATIFVILDGENAWEHFEDQGRPFLRALYATLASNPEIQTVTMAEACASPREVLPSIFPGSWINADFYIWIGHPDDHRAWGQLADARRALDAAGDANAAARDRATEELLIAEGSDWFWWYGDDHSSDHDHMFDALFRSHVANVYRALGQAVPEELFLSNITTQVAPSDVQLPTALVRPTIDGKATHYFEWLGCGRVAMQPAGDAMHQVSAPEGVVTSIEFGFDLEFLYLRLAGSQAMKTVLSGNRSVRLNFLQPAGARVTVERTPGGSLVAHVATPGATPGPSLGTREGLHAVAGEILELRLPFAHLGVGAGDSVSFFVAVSVGEVTAEHYPRHRPVAFAVPDAGYQGRHWAP